MFGKMKSASGLGHSHFTEVAPQAPWCWLYQIQTLAPSFSCVPDIASFHPWPYAAAKGARLAQSLAAAHQENQVVLCK